MLIALAPQLQDFIPKLFNIEPEARALAERHHELAPIFSVKRLFVQRQALSKYKPEEVQDLDADAAEQAWRQRGLFNVIDLESGWKVDLILRKERAFSREEFSRREPATILGARVFVATAEDTILAKLEWAQRGESERQLRDVAGVLAMRGGDLDRAYLERWAAELGVEAELARVRGEGRA